MGFLFLGLTAVVTVFAFRFWRAFFAARAKRFHHPVGWDSGPMTVAHLPALLMPEADRRVWNFMVLTGAFIALGLPHWLVLWNFWRGEETLLWLLVNYAWTLVYWVGLVAGYAFIVARVQESVAREQVSKDDIA